MSVSDEAEEPSDVSDCLLVKSRRSLDIDGVIALIVGRDPGFD